jgi:hypothetical protein
MKKIISTKSGIDTRTKSSGIRFLMIFGIILTLLFMGVGIAGAATTTVPVNPALK